MAKAKWQIERDAAQAGADALRQRERDTHSALTRLDHLVLWCSGAWECARCGASGSLYTGKPLPERKCGT
jgi:hypothetical protein